MNHYLCLRSRRVSVVHRPIELATHAGCRYFPLLRDSLIEKERRAVALTDASRWP
jgi:hypothetical protein